MQSKLSSKLWQTCFILTALTAQRYS